LPAEAEHPPACEAALATAYGFLDKRERTVAEVRHRLERAGIETAATEFAVAELTAIGALDDARYARLFAEDKRALEGWGSERISRVLRKRGIDRELVEQALGAAADSELDRAVALLRQRFPLPPADRRDRERALGVLLRKGYDGELALDALRRHAG
jgi:regulatory protein